LIQGQKLKLPSAKNRFESIISANGITVIWCVVDNGRADVAVDALGFGSKAGGPGDVTMGGWIKGVWAFGEDPAVAGVMHPQGQEVGGYVVMGGVARDLLFADGELVHEKEANVGLFGAEIDSLEGAAELLGSFPADLTTETGFVAAALNGAKVFHEGEENVFDEMPVVGSTGEESGELEAVADEAIDVDDGEIATAGRGDIEAEAILVGLVFREQVLE
jgi:hypothetical protein